MILLLFHVDITLNDLSNIIEKEMLDFIISLKSEQNLKLGIIDISNIKLFEEQFSKNIYELFDYVFTNNDNQINCLQYLEQKNFNLIHYFCNKIDDKINNYVFLNDIKLITHKVNTFFDTIQIIKQILKSYIPVIMCGGSGSRLYPISRENFPKQFIKINSQYSLLQNTILRFSNLKHIILVSNKSHHYILENQIIELIRLNIISTDIKFDIFLEPSARNTAPLVNLITQSFPNTKLLFLPCDHIYDKDLLIQTINMADKLSKPIVTFGIKPTNPDTGFGYIEYDEKTQIVNKFVEKPNIKIATQYINTGNYYWNSGIFLYESNIINELFDKLQPNISNVIKKIVSEIKLNLNKKNITNINFIDVPKLYSECSNISIDYAIMEILPIGSINMIIYDGLWNDIGTFKSIHDVSIKDDFNITLSEKQNIIQLNSSNCLIDSKKLIMLNDVKDLAIIDTIDGLLISNINSTQNIKNIYQIVKDSSKTEINFNHIDYKPWGIYEVLAESENTDYKIKKITVYPNKKLSLQSYTYQKKLTCLSGSGLAQINDQFIKLENYSTVEIDIEQKYHLINNSESILEIIEIQLGS